MLMLAYCLGAVSPGHLAGGSRYIVLLSFNGRVSFIVIELPK